MSDYLRGVRAYRDGVWVVLWHGTTNGNVQKLRVSLNEANDLLHELEALLRSNAGSTHKDV